MGVFYQSHLYRSTENSIRQWCTGFGNIRQYRSHFGSRYPNRADASHAGLFFVGPAKKMTKINNIILFFFKFVKNGVCVWCMFCIPLQHNIGAKMDNFCPRVLRTYAICAFLCAANCPNNCLFGFFDPPFKGELRKRGY